MRGRCRRGGSRIASQLRTPGPQMLAVVPFLLVWRAAMQPPRRTVGIVLTAAVVAFWANVHGSFILIYPLLGAPTGFAATLVVAVLIGWRVGPWWREPAAQSSAKSPAKSSAMAAAE